MDEFQIDSFIGEIAAEMEIIRVVYGTEATLTDEQDAAIKKLPKAQREDAKKQILKEANERRKDRLSLLVSALEEKIKAAGLPAATKEQLLQVMNQAKDTGWAFSPQAIEKIEEIRDEQNAQNKEKIEQKNQSDSNLENLALMAVTGAAVAAVHTVAKTTAEEKQQIVTFFDEKDIEIKHAPSTTMREVGGIMMFTDEAKEKNPEYVQKAQKAGQKALKKIDTNKAPMSVDVIRNAANLSPVEQRYAMAAFLEQNPAIKADKIFEDTALQQRAAFKSIARHEAKNNPQKAQERRQNKRPDYDKKEALVMKRVNKIKQKAGTLLSMDEIKAELKHPTLIRIYEETMHKYHPEYFQNQDKEAQKRETIAKIRTQKKLYQRSTLQQKMAERQVEKPQQARANPRRKLKRSLNLRSTVVENGKPKHLATKENKTNVALDKKKNTHA